MNKKTKIAFWVLLAWLLASPGLLLAQDVEVKRVEKTVTIGGKQFFMHHVRKGETLYGITKAYKVTEDELAAFNPELKTAGLRVGTVIGIPAKPELLSQETPVTPQPEAPKPVESKPETPKPEPAKPTTHVSTMPRTINDTIVEVGGKRYVMHYVKKGETVWGLSRTFHVPESEIMAKNPEIKAGLKAGMVIGIPYVDQPREPIVVTPVPVKPEPEKPELEKTEPEKPEPENPEPEKPEPVVIVPVTPDPPTTEEPEKPVVVIVKPVEKPETTVIAVSADDEYGDGYVIHTVKKAEKTRAMLRDWNVSEEEFRQLNPSVGSRVFVGQRVLIPYIRPQGEVAATQTEEPPVEQQEVDETVVDLPVDEPIVDEHTGLKLLYSSETPSDCYASSEHANKQYHVALLVPLYLDEVDKLDASRDRVEKTKKTRSMRFLQYYEGFMMAVDSLTDYYGLNLDLTVIDVTENTAGAIAAVDKLRDMPVDLIIGPFFSKSFAIVQAYAASQGILVVNPLSERESVVADASNVLKLKPSNSSMVTALTDLIRNNYPKSKVTLITPAETTDTVMVDAIEHALATMVPPEVQLSNAEMLDLIAKESQRRKMGKRLLQNLEVEGQIFSTKSLEAHPDDVTVFENHFQHITYTDNEIKTFVNGLSSARENVLVAYGNDLVFATKVLNNINKSAQKFPITLIGLPQWGGFENLLVQNLLNMNAIYFDDHFVNYNDSVVLQFVDDFRLRYSCEPMDYAFEGFDVGWYFLNALMELGSQPVDCLPYYHKSLLHANYYFNKSRVGDGLENRYWNIYQYDPKEIELKPVSVYKGE